MCFPKGHTLDLTLCASFGPQPAFFISSCRRWKSSWPEAMICLAAHQKHQKSKGTTRHTNMLNNLVSQTNQEPKRNIKSNQLMDLSEGSRKIGYPKAPWINIISIPFRFFTKIGGRSPIVRPNYHLLFHQILILHPHDIIPLVPSPCWWLVKIVHPIESNLQQPIWYPMNIPWISHEYPMNIPWISHETGGLPRIPSCQFPPGWATLSGDQSRGHPGMKKRVPTIQFHVISC